MNPMIRKAISRLVPFSISSDTFAISEAYYSKPLRFLKLSGTFSPKAYGSISVHATKDLCIGTATCGIWSHGIVSISADRQTWVFTKVCDLESILGEKNSEPSILLKLAQRDGRTLWKRAALTIRDDIPNDYVSSIGTKRGLMIRKDPDEFCQRQRKCDFQPNIHLLHIESSSLCNLRCQYCVVSNNYESIERCVLRDDVLDAAIEAVNDMPSINLIQVSGLGEPLTNPRFCDMLWRIYRETKVRRIWFFSNGMLLSREISDELAEIPLQFKIYFSIDGRTPRENGVQRCGSEYEEIRRNIYYFLSKIDGKPNFQVKIHNLILADEEESVQTPAFLLNDFGMLEIDTHRAFYFPELSTETLRKSGIESHREPHKQICKRMFSQATIRSNGDVIRCHWDSACEIVMGNVLQRPLREIWYGEEYRQMRKTMMPEVPFGELPAVCQKCHVMNEGYLYRKRSGT